MARPAHRRIDGDSSSVFGPWSIVSPEPLAGLATGIAAAGYGGVYLTLLLRDTWNAVPDLLAFALFVGVTIIGLANVLRWLPALGHGSVACVASGYLLVIAGWGYLSVAHATPLSDPEGLIYGVIAAFGLAAILDDVRTWARTSGRPVYKQRWLVLPAAVFALWAVMELGGLPARRDVLALVAIAAGLAAVLLGSSLSRR